MLTDPKIYERISSYAFDDPEMPRPSFGFVDRLCLETGWKRKFAEGAMREYRRFVYLAVTSARQMTPSREVDAVWHLHLTYTRSYWKRLRAILPRDLHHEPTPGSSEAAMAYVAQYADTKARYLAEFGESPPDDYWPPEAERFQTDVRRMRSDFLESKEKSHVLGAQSSALLALTLAAGGISIAAMTGSASAIAGSGTANDTAISVIATVAGLTVAIIAFSMLFGRRRSPDAGKKNNNNGDGSVYYGGDAGSGGEHGRDHGGEHGGEGSGGESGGESGGGDGGGGGCGGGGCSS